MNVSELAVGQKFGNSVQFPKEDVLRFADLTHDHNPIHLDDAAARAKNWKRAVVHGFLVAACATPMIVDHLPGIQLREIESLKFRQPVYVGDSVLIEAMLEELENRPMRGNDVYIMKFGVNYFTRSHILAAKAIIRGIFTVAHSDRMIAVA